MSLRSGHGNGKGVPRIETLPCDELPKGVKAPPPTPEAPEERDAKGRFQKGSRTAQARGGKRNRSTVKLTRQIGLMKEDQFITEFRPYKRAAEAYRRAMISELAQLVGGGSCGVMASGFISNCALQEAAGTFWMEQGMKTGNASLTKMGSSMLNDAKQSKLAAYEMCSKMNGGGKRGAGKDALAQAQADFQRFLMSERKPKPALVSAEGEAVAE